MAIRLSCRLTLSEFENYIHRELELVLASPEVVRGTIHSMIGSDFGTKQNSASHPVSPHQRRLRVAILEAGSLTFYVIQEVRPNRKIIFCVELLFDVVDHGPLRREAADLARGTVRAIRAFFRCDRTRDAGHVALIHVPGLGRHMP